MSTTQRFKRCEVCVSFGVDLRININNIRSVRSQKAQSFTLPKQTVEDERTRRNQSNGGQVDLGFGYLKGTRTHHPFRDPYPYLCSYFHFLITLMTSQNKRSLSTGYLFICVDFESVVWLTPSPIHHHWIPSLLNESNKRISPLSVSITVRNH